MDNPVNPQEPNTHWEREVLANFAQAYLKEIRNKRRWSLVYRSLILIWLVLFTYFMFSEPDSGQSFLGKPHVASIDITGGIFDQGDSSAESILNGLTKAYENKNTTAIILKINSPGGSPVQAAYVYDELHRQRTLHPDIKIYAVCTDLCASAAYYIAAGADEIYANPSSLVGSIGVLYNGFGFTSVMDKIGVERRLVTAGKNKGFLDPYSPDDPAQTEFLKSMLAKIHQQFIASVKEGRGKRLKNTPDLFSGLFWTGVQAKDLGLIDGFGSTEYVAREIIKNDKIVDYTPRPGLFDRAAKSLGVGMAGQMSNMLGLTTPLR
jgi:protease-4